MSICPFLHPYQEVLRPFISQLIDIENEMNGICKDNGCDELLSSIAYQEGVDAHNLFQSNYRMTHKYKSIYEMNLQVLFSDKHYITDNPIAYYNSVVNSVN